MNEKILKETLIGIDYGGVHTGVALGRNGLVAPLGVISNKKDPELIHELVRIIIENKGSKFILGLPLLADGKNTAQAVKVRTFANLLKIMSRRPVVFQNEYETSKESTREAIGMGIPRDKRSKNDHLAAALILKAFYQEQTAL